LHHLLDEQQARIVLVSLLGAWRSIGDDHFDDPPDVLFVPENGHRAEPVGMSAFLPKATKVQRGQ
jgi:hypothetical protein